MGYLILTYASQRPYLFSVAISGFLLIGPLTAAGIYEISRQREAGRRIGFLRIASGPARASRLTAALRDPARPDAGGGERISAIMFALFYSDRVPDLANFYRDVFFSGDYLQFVIAYVLAGGLIACIVFSISVVSVPMMMARDVDIMTAMATSARAAYIIRRPWWCGWAAGSTGADRLRDHDDRFGHPAAPARSCHLACLPRPARVAHSCDAQTRQRRAQGRGRHFLGTMLPTSIPSIHRDLIPNEQSPAGLQRPSRFDTIRPQHVAPR